MLAIWRGRMDDIAKPYLWSDAEGVFFANEAENEACVRASLLEEDSVDSALVNIDGEADVAEYSLDPRIIEVRSAMWGGHFLEPVSRSQLEDQSVRTRYGGYFEHREWAPNVDWSTLTGTPRLFISPQEKYLTIVRKPTVAAPIRLSAYRLPLEPMDLTDPDRGPEIPSRYHLFLIDWMEHLALDITDPDKGNPERAAKKEVSFTTKFGVRHDADTQRTRKEKRSNQVRMNPSW